jgi:hypothetical protein
MYAMRDLERATRAGAHLRHYDHAGGIAERYPTAAADFAGYRDEPT